MANKQIVDRLESALGRPPRRIGPLSGGCVGEVYRLDMPDGMTLVAKVDNSIRPALDREAFMLRFLADHSKLPVPEIVYADSQLLVIEYLPGASHFSGDAQEHAAELLADLHSIKASAFGLDEHDLIGGLHQPNPWIDSWLEFFRDHRLLYMADQALQAGQLPAPLFKRIHKLADRLQTWLVEPAYPSLIHGDVWTTNILAEGGRITGFLDPATYFADSEIELAFITLFNTFGSPFFRRYDEIRPIHPDFWKKRRELYNLYPLLVHVRLFGGGYVSSVERTLAKFGC
ncbi:MAG: fructosamine kinase family protein [Chloroflexi bacterium]|nr:fructosamine kinase family protein [Chloroflexota bacterium]